MGDLLSFWMTNLTIWILSVISLININNMKTMTKISSMLIIVLMMTFFNWNFMMFFIMFELSMILIVVIIMSWGYQPERIEATMFMIILTSMFTLPFFSSLMHNLKKLNFWFLMDKMAVWDFTSFMLIFMVKLPVYFIHVWLPKVHVESPVQGSMILASIMLKLGCFGMMRMTKMATKMMATYEFIIMAFALWTTLILSLVCNIQSDLKSLVAYSSVVHMSATLISISLAKSKSILASIIIMIGHGMCSSAMFFMCNQAYKISKSRSMMLNKGILICAPPAATMWFTLCMINAPMPPSINIMGELLTFKNAITWSTTMLTMVFLIMLFSSCYSIIVFCVMAHGKFSTNMKWSPSMTAKSAMISTMHVLPAVALIIKSSVMMV